MSETPILRWREDGTTGGAIGPGDVHFLFLCRPLADDVDLYRVGWVHTGWWDPLTPAPGSLQDCRSTAQSWLAQVYAANAQPGLDIHQQAVNMLTVDRLAFASEVITHHEDGDA